MAAGAEVPVRLDHVTLRYGDSLALDDVTLEVCRGERVCVLGANGSGKSTLASVICGLLAPDEGDVELAGHAVCTGGVPDLAAYWDARRQLGLVFQNPDDQIVTSVVADDVAFGPENLGVPRAQIATRVARELRRVAMEKYAHADPSRLSGGQRQRVCIAGALAMEPAVLVLDEPSSLLDVRGRAAIMRVMGRLAAAGATLVHVTHFMDEALAADRVIVMQHGHVALEGTPDEVFATKNAQVIEALGLEMPFEARLAAALRADAADGGAKYTTTVDLSRPSLDWARRNMARNGFTGPEHEFVQADVIEWVNEQRHTRNRWDLVFCDVPTFSNSQRMKKSSWDVQRDHSELIIGVSRLLTRNGCAIFSCNLRGFKPDTEALSKAGVVLEDITASTIPEDFKRNSKIHHAYIVRRG